MRFANTNSARLIAQHLENSVDSLAQLAKAMRVSTRTVYRWASGESKPRGAALVLLWAIPYIAPNAQEALGLGQSLNINPQG